jgi:hypothetical protein
MLLRIPFDGRPIGPDDGLTGRYFGPEVFLWEAVIPYSDRASNNGISSVGI